VVNTQWRRNNYGHKKLMIPVPAPNWKATFFHTNLKDNFIHLKGGSLGLFTGMSLLSIIECVYWFCAITIILLHRFIRRRNWIFYLIVNSLLIDESVQDLIKDNIQLPILGILRLQYYTTKFRTWKYISIRFQLKKNGPEQPNMLVQYINTISTLLIKINA
jgi:hypothetical protein